MFTPPARDAAPADPELAAAGVPDTSPTWELELLISGAVLFALFQIPGAIDDFFGRLEPHATATASAVVFFVGLYVRAMVFALTAAFVVHLVARAYWVGLVGLHSVFPRGVRWEEMKIGPITERLYRERLSSLPRIIARTDNFCSVIFSFAFLLVLLFAFTIVISGAFGLMAYGLAHLFEGGRNTRHYFLALGVVFVAVPLATSVVDRRWGARLAPEGRASRVVALAARYGYRISFLNVTGPVFLTLLTNLGRRRVMLIFYAALLGTLVVVSAQRLAASDRLSINSYDFFGASEDHGVNYRFYENQRGDAILPRTPSIQSDVIRDPYVKLFIPYSPARHNAALVQRCPRLHVLQQRGIQLGADAPVPDSLAVPVLNCLTTLHEVALNGAPLRDPDFRFYEHPGTGMKGIIAYIPVDTLPRGRNVITVKPVPRPDDTRGTPPRPYVIPFWK